MLDINVNKLKENLAHFTGTEAYYKWSVLSPSVLTDGTKYVAKELGAYWLFDVIASHIEHGDMPKQNMYFSKLAVDDGSAKLTIDDGNGKTLAQQEIDFTDFPLDSIDIWSQWDGSKWVHHLPSEY